MMNRTQEIKENIEEIKTAIYEAAIKCGRNHEEIALMAVSKTKPKEDILAAYNAGQRLFGENRIAEAAEKFKDTPKDIELHMIGNLQSNKANIAVKTANCIQSIHKLKTAKELNKRAETLNKTIDILIEINTSGESTKEGYANFDEILKDLSLYCDLKFIRLRGLMTVGPFTSEEKKIRKSFSDLFKYFEKLKREIPNERIDILSMGMSLDYKIAIEEGSNLLRIGTAIFGSRSCSLKK